jgi:asparagine synthase (glutamine-hydrolysing)
MIMACETPNHTWGPINHYLLSRYISAEHGIPVLLDGQGGDEAFSGYPWFFATIERFITSMMSADKAASLRAAYQSKLPLPAPALNICQRMYFSRRIWVETFEDGALAALGVSPDEVLDWAPVNYYLNDEMDWSSFREHEFYRRELQHLLRQEDRLGMWFGIENRVPYLDHKLVELIGLFSPQFLLKDGFLKYPLRVLFPKLPDRLRFNVLKKGFWESYSRLPPLDHVKLAAWQDLNDLSTLIPEQRQLRALGPMARWRFFQIAVLSQVSSKEDKLVT